MTSPLTVQLAHYEGPLDLLLDLIRKQQVDIYDIPIASITAQYLHYVEEARALDMELSSDFVYMAATLIHIKSRTLLPKDPELDKLLPEEDPRQELVQRLVEHERFKGAAEMLQQKRLIEEAVWSNPQMQMFAQEEEQPGLSVTLFDLVKTLQQVVDRVKARPVYEVDRDSVTVPDMIRHLRALLEDPAIGGLSATRLFEEQGSRRAMICLFLAILELVKRQAIQLSQGDAFGDITLRRSETFAAVFAAVPDSPEIEDEYR